MRTANNSTKLTATGKHVMFIHVLCGYIAMDPIMLPNRFVSSIKNKKRQKAQ
jgi:hypothetical protein